MTGRDELRDRIRALDPVARASVESPDPERARNLLEDIMSNPVESAQRSAGTNPSRRTTRLVAGAAAAVVAVGIAVAALGGGGSDEPTVLALSAGSVDPMMQSCMPVDAAIVADMPTAFRGEATAVDGAVVTLEVDRWYAGGDADVVEVTAPAVTGGLIGDITFTEGETYLVSAYEGVVSFCGLTGPATPELQAIFDEAFPS